MHRTDCLCRLVLCGAAALLIGLATPAEASDLLPVESTQWGGFYVGGQLGGAWSDSDWRYTNHNWFDTFGSELLFTRFGFDGSGVIGGGQAGYNYQSGAWVAGVEGSLAGADLDDSYSGSVFPVDRYATKSDLLTTLTGRVGYAQDRWLLYAKAGWAGADIELTVFDREDNIRAHSDTWANGWTVGGGGEYALGRSVSLGIEYDYADLDRNRLGMRCNCPGGLGGGVPSVEGDITIQSVTARLNYRFGR